MREYRKSMNDEQKAFVASKMSNWEKLNREQRNEYKRNYFKDHPEVKMAQRERYYAKHKEEIKAGARSYREAHIEQARASARKYAKTPAGRLNSYKMSAKKRGLDFSLSTEDFNALLSQDCHYCGCENARGVDRKDSSIGYYSYNVVACCKICNYMKKDHNYPEFISHVLKIVENLT